MKNKIILFVGMIIFFIISILMIIFPNINNKNDDFWVEGSKINAIWYFFLSLNIAIAILAILVLCFKNIILISFGIGMSIFVCIAGFGFIIPFGGIALLYIIPFLINIIGAVLFLVFNNKQKK